MQGAVLYVDQGNTRSKFWLIQAGQTLCSGGVCGAAELQQALQGKMLHFTYQPANAVRFKVPSEIPLQSL